MAGNWMEDFLTKKNRNTTPWIKIARFLHHSKEHGMFCIGHDSSYMVNMVLSESAINSFERRRDLSVKNLLGANIVCKTYSFTCRKKNCFDLSLEVTSFDSPGGGSCSAENIDNLSDIMTNLNVQKIIQKRFIKQCNDTFMKPIKVQDLLICEAETLDLASPSNWRISQNDTIDLDDSWGATPMSQVTVSPVKKKKQKLLSDDSITSGTSKQSVRKDEYSNQQKSTCEENTNVLHSQSFHTPVLEPEPMVIMTNISDSTTDTSRHNVWTCVKDNNESTPYNDQVVTSSPIAEVNKFTEANIHNEGKKKLGAGENKIEEDINVLDAGLNVNKRKVDFNISNVGVNELIVGLNKPEVGRNISNVGTNELNVALKKPKVSMNIPNDGVNEHKPIVSINTQDIDAILDTPVKTSKTNTDDGVKNTSGAANGSDSTYIFTNNISEVADYDENSTIFVDQNNDNNVGGCEHNSKEKCFVCFIRTNTRVPELVYLEAKQLNFKCVCRQ